MGGDVLVVALVYCALLSVVQLPRRWAVAAVLGLAFTIEFLQRTSWLQVLGLERSRIARIVLGSAFTWSDLLAYSLGAIGVLAVEAWVDRRWRS